MRLLLISNMYPSESHPGYGVFVQNFEKGIIECGGTVHKAVIRGKGKNKIEKIFKYVKFFFDVYKTLLNNHYDVIYVHYMAHSLLPLLLLSKFLKKPLILNAHGEDVLIDSKLGAFIKKLVSPMIEKAQMIVVPSKYFKVIVSETFHVKPQNIFISPSGGIDTTLFKSLETSRNTHVFTIGYISRIDEGKGWDLLLDATKVLVENNIKDFKVLMIGGGTQITLLTEKIDILNLQNYITYFGPKPHDELVYYYNQMDVFAFTTTRLAESLGLVGLEAMACGVPVIGSNIGGLKEYIKTGYNGDLFEPANSNELAEKIKSFMKLDVDKKTILKNNAIETAKKYDSKKINNDLYNKIKEIVHSKQG